MFRRGFLIVVLLVALVAFLTPAKRTTPRALAIPVAVNDTTYKLLGRVFPDPQACTKGTPGNSPWAKGNVCATHFLQWDETLAGLRYLQGKFPRFGHLENLHDLKATVPEFAKLGMQSAGLPQADGTRAKRDLYAFVVTDDQSPVPLAERHRFAFSLSIHGIERAGLEGGVRAAEDLMTWAATAPDTRILEPTKSGPTARDVLRNSVLYFVLSNPDGWGRGEITKGGVYFQRYNGNGADVNRDFPTVGYANPVYTPESEPEQLGYAAYLRRERERAGRAFTGGGDLHGMIAADSFSFTLLAGTAETWEENARVIGSAQAIYADAVKRLSYSPLIADPKECPGDVPVFVFVADGSLPMCPDQWGTVWDTIDYQTTGSFGDWMASEIGLGATAVDNEMAYSHTLPNDVFVPAIEQLHVDGNKGIIYSQLAALGTPTSAPPAVTSSVGYAPSVQRKVRAQGVSQAVGASARPQADFAAREIAGRGIEFDVQGPADNVANGALSAEFTMTNVDGISTESLSDIVIERFDDDHGGDGAWSPVAQWYRQEPTYLPAGARIDIKQPAPGRYRLSPSLRRHGITTMRVHFTPVADAAKPVAAYDVANTDVFKGLGGSVRAITPAQILANPRALDGVQVYALADDPAPGVAAKDRAAWFAALKTFATNGGTLVLTDHALDALAELGVVPASALVKGVEYGGWISFTDDKNQVTFGKSPLTKALDLPGASDGSGAGLERRRQTYDPGALGYPISASPGPDCSFGDACHAPQEMVNVDAWRKAGGTVVGRTAVVVKPNSGEPIGVAYGEAPLGKGRVRIAGGLLPTPTQAFNHPYGLEGYALSWTGWQVLSNLLTADRARGVDTSVLGISELPRTGDDAAVPLDLAAVVIAAAALVRFGRARRRLHTFS